MASDDTLRDQLIQLLDSGHAHLRFEDAVRDFPAAWRGKRPPGGAHSAWELLEHLRIALWDIVEFSRDAKHVSPAWPAGYWPPNQEPPDDAAWEASVAAYSAHLRAFEAMVADESVDLFARIPHGDGQTVLREVLLAVDHNAYHLGQLVMLRRLLSRSGYRPSAAAPVTAEAEGGRWRLTFIRELPHAPEEVWRMLTSHRDLREWAPFDADRDLGKTGQATLTMAGGGNETAAATVRHAEAPRLLEYSWGEDVLRWELEPHASGTRLTLRHTTGDRTFLPKIAAGWHICLDVAERALAGEPVGRIVGQEARSFGWEELNAGYASALGIENTGWPLG